MFNNFTKYSTPSRYVSVHFTFQTMMIITIIQDVAVKLIHELG